MAAVMREGVSGSDLGEKPHLVVKLKAGWTFESARREFVSAAGKRFSPRTHLPKRSQIVYMTPSLAGEKPESLSEDERKLARYLQIILPKGQSPSDYLAVVAGWECVADVRLPPEISLP